MLNYLCSWSVSEEHNAGTLLVGGQVSESIVDSEISELIGLDVLLRLWCLSRCEY